MGTIASRDCLRVLQLTEQVASASLLAATQAIELRKRNNELDQQHFSPALKEMLEAVQTDFEFVVEDRPLEADLRKFVGKIQQQEWKLY